MRFFLCLFLFFLGCGRDENVVKVAASSVPHAEILEVIKPDFEKQGYKLKIIVIDDYQLPNRLLAEKQVDANFFQHEPFLEKEMGDFGYDLKIMARVHIEPLGIYSNKIKSLNEIEDESIVSIPSDPTNEARALLLLQKANLITLKDNASFYATVLDIKNNPKHLKIKEIDAPLLPRTLSDVDIAVIPGNFALMSNLCLKDALLLESADSPYVNILVVRKEDENRADLILLSKLLNSENVKKFVLEKYQGQVICY